MSTNSDFPLLLLLCIWPVADIADSVHDEGGDKAKPDSALEARKAKLNMQSGKAAKKQSSNLAEQQFSNLAK